MGFKQFNVAVVATVVALMAVFAGANYSINLFDVFGDAHGKSSAVPSDKLERLAKYLFSLNYIPANFDGLLIGSSVSDNWDTSVLHVGRIYNASLNGGNITEEALIVDNVFQRRSLKTALFVIYPYLTETHTLKSEYMTPHEYWSALGSIQLLKAYWAKRGAIGGRPETEFSPFGQFQFDVPRVIEKNPPHISDFTVDGQAFTQYQDLLGKARLNGAKVVGIIPLLTKLSEDVNGAAYERYNAKVRALFHTEEPVIDLNLCPELASLRTDDASFPDGHHYSNAAARQIMEALGRRLTAVPLQP